jgi:hypothetical protein
MFGVSASGAASKDTSKTKSSINQVANSAASSGVSPFLEAHFRKAAVKATQNSRTPLEDMVYQGPRVANFSADTQAGFDNTRERALGNQGYLDQALSNLGQSAQGRDYAPKELLDLIQNAGVNGQNAALGATNRAFQGSGFNSPLHSMLAAREGSRAMGETAIPALSDLYTNEANRREAAIRDLPGMYTETSRAPGDLLREIGGEQDMRNQAVLQGRMDKVDETNVARDDQANQYLNQLLGMGQLFRTQANTSSAKTKSKAKTTNKSKSVEAGGSYGF